MLDEDRLRGKATNIQIVADSIFPIAAGFRIFASMSEVVTFGEIMLRLTPPGNLRLTQTPHFEITFGGAEANVAVMIAQLGCSAGFVTRLPANDLAQRVINELRGLGVDTASIARGGDRM